MTEMPTATPPRCVEVEPTKTVPDARLRRLQLRLRELAIQAGRGAGSDPLVPALRELFRREVSTPASLPAAERLRVGTTFLHGVCGLARWFDPARSVQAVPPLCVGLWHVGAAFETRDPSTLWIDFVLPHDGRRQPAIEWAHDIRMLLLQAGIPHRAESVLVPPLAVATPPTLRDAGAWGCMSLWQAYRCSGEVVQAVRR